MRTNPTETAGPEAGLLVILRKKPELTLVEVGEGELQYVSSIVRVYRNGIPYGRFKTFEDFQVWCGSGFKVQIDPRSEYWKNLEWGKLVKK